jgi:HEAT repeat protein
VSDGAREYLETIRLAGTDDRLRRMAFDHLRRLRGNGQAQAVLMQARGDKDAAVRGAAAAALGS